MKITAIVSTMVCWFEKQLANYDTVSTSIEEFVLKHRNAVEIIFTLAHAVQQIALVVCAFIFIAQLQLIISLCAVISLSTFALQKLCMDFRIKSLEEKGKSIIEGYNKRLASYICEGESESLNNRHTTNNFGVDELRQEKNLKKILIAERRKNAKIMALIRESHEKFVEDLGKVISQF